jgi:maltose alpha-D-glucosyltransferase / alpha-amylase
VPVAPPLLPLAGFTTAARAVVPVIETPPYDCATVNVRALAERSDSLLIWLRAMLKVRRRFSAFGAGQLSWIETSSPHALAYLRHDSEASILCVANLAGEVNESQCG